MNIVLATDDNFVQHCCVAMTSVLLHTKNVHFYIFTEGISSNNEELLKNHVRSLGGIIDFCIVDSRIVSQFPMPSNADAHISIATYYRLFSAEILPKEVEKIIYMDCDMVAMKDFVDLWNINIDGYAIGAVYQPLTDSQAKDKQRLLMDENAGYFNAGMLLVNLNYWRVNAVTERLLGFIKTNYSRIKQHDQDVLNAVLNKEVIPLDYTWNFTLPFFCIASLKFPTSIDYSEQITEPANIHYVSAPKPWEYGCEHPLRKEYYRVLDKTPFKGEKPKFIFRKYYNNVIRIKFLKLICTIDKFGIRHLLKS